MEKVGENGRLGLGRLVREREEVEEGGSLLNG